MAFLDETGLAELWSIIKAEDAKLSAKDAKVVAGTYVGTCDTSVLPFVGTHQTIPLGFTPDLVYVHGGGDPFTAVPGLPGGYQNIAHVVVVDGGFVVATTQYFDGSAGCNHLGQTYKYFAVKNGG